MPNKYSGTHKGEKKVYYLQAKQFCCNALVDHCQKFFLKNVSQYIY